MTRPRDPGLQPERTALAWSRTGLAVLVNAVLVVRAGASHGSTAVGTLGAVLLAGAAIVLAAGAWRGRVLRGDGTVHAPRWPLMVALAGMALAACLAAVAVVGLEAAAWHHR